jgi:hypothetical protein
MRPSKRSTSKTKCNVYSRKRSKKEKTQMTALIPNDDVTEVNATISSPTLNLKRYYIELHRVFKTERAKRFGAVVEDDGTHMCNSECTMIEVHGVVHLLSDGSHHICLGKLHCSDDTSKHAKPRDVLRDLYICSTTMCAHVCTPELCQSGVQTSEGKKCQLTGRFVSIEPAYTQGWQDDPWRAPCPRELSSCKTSDSNSGIDETITMRQLAVRLRKVQSGPYEWYDTLKYNISTAISAIMPYGQRRIKWQDLKQTRRYALMTTAVGRYKNSQDRDEKPIFLDEITVLCRAHETEESSFTGLLDEEQIISLVSTYATACLDYVMSLLDTTVIFDSDFRVNDTIIAVLYLRRSKLRVNGITIFAAEPVLRCLLPQAHALSFIFERNMSCFSGSLAYARESIILSARSNLHSSSKLQFPLFDSCSSDSVMQLLS